MIEIRALTYRYSKCEFELSVPQLSIAHGEKVAIVGPSGCGKSTLLMLLAGVLLPNSGEVQFNGENWNHLSDDERRQRRASKIGFVFQDFELLDYLSIHENILLPYHINRELKLTDSVNANLDRLVEAMQLGDKLHRRPGQLSHGERQRASLCRALITQPELILADEPTGSLDPHNTHIVLGLLLSQASLSNSTLVFVTHDHSLLERFDRTIHLDAITHGATPADHAAIAALCEDN